MKILTFISACLAIAAVDAGKGKGIGKGMGMGKGKGKGGKKHGSRSRDVYDSGQNGGDDATHTGKLCREFETSFVITYSGPQEVFDESNPEAIAFLEESIRDVYNAEVTHHSQKVLDSVTLEGQSLAEESSGNNRRLQSSAGLRYKLLNVYSAKGRCRNCRRNSNLLKNDAVRKLGEGLSRGRELHQSQGSGISRFNFFLVERLTNQDEFDTFLSITEASISNSVPISLLAIDTTTPPGGFFTNDSQDDPFELAGGGSP